MKHTQEEILNALRIIRNECEGYDTTKCNECPFFDEYSNRCMFGNFEPHTWQLAYETPTTWRAFL